MFGLRKSTELEVPPCPPTAEEIIEDLEKAGPDDVVFTTEINATDLDPLPNTFNLTKRFQTTKETLNLEEQSATTITNSSSSSTNNQDSQFYEKVIAYNQNVEKLNTLRQKLNKKLEDLETVKGELTEDLAKVIQSHSEAVDQHQKIIANNPNNA